MGQSSSYYVLLVVKSGYVSRCCIFCLSRFFCSRTHPERGRCSRRKMVRARIRTLRVLSIWSGVIFMSIALLGTTYRPAEYLFMRLGPGARPRSVLRTLLCYFYLLSRSWCPLPDRGPAAPVDAALIPTGRNGLRYLQRFGVEIPGLDLLIGSHRLVTPPVIFFFRWALWPLLHPRIQAVLAPRRWALLAATVALYLVTLSNPSDPPPDTRQLGRHGQDTFLQSMRLACHTLFSGL